MYDPRTNTLSSNSKDANEQLEMLQLARATDVLKFVGILYGKLFTIDRSALRGSLN